MESSGSSSSPSQSPIDLTPPSRSARSSFSEHTRKARRSKDGPNNLGSSMRDVARVLVARERDTMDLKRTLYTLGEQLKAERQRADAAENKTHEVLALFKSANEAKIAAEQESSRANEGLRLYKLQYENAQAEIRRAQKLIDALEAQRVDAEEAAAKARSTARKLKEEKIVMRAREEGRMLGIEEGRAQGRILGYEEGREAEYEHARAASERAYTSAPVTEMDFGEPRTRDLESVPIQVSRPSTSEDSEPDVGRNYTQPLDDIRPPVTTSVRVPTPSAVPVIPPLEKPRAAQPVPIHPSPVPNIIFSPSHAPVEVPPDGWIPSMDGDQRIRIPPPHEMGPPPPTTPSPPLSAVLNNVKNIPDEPIMIPPPAHPDSDMHNRRPRHRRRNSVESQSTTMSQFEILDPPSVPSTVRGMTRERPPVLSAIAEERERTSTASSPVYMMPNLSSQSVQMPSPSHMSAPSPPPGNSFPPPQNPSYSHPPSQNPPPPQNPVYADTMPRYRSRENLSRSGSVDDYYRENTPLYPGAEDGYRTPRPDREDENRTPQPQHTLRDDSYRTPRSDATPRDGYRVPRSDTAPPEDPYRNPTSRYPVAEDPSRDAGAYGRYTTHDNASRSAAPSSIHRYPSQDSLRQTRNIYAPPHSPHSSPDTSSPAIVAPMPSLRPPPSQYTPENRGSMSSNEVEIQVTVEPPSRPESNISIPRTDVASPHRLFLSAEDADRPLPAVPSEPEPPQPARPPSPVIPPTAAGIHSGSWPPPGFVPTGPSSPLGSSTVGPAGVPLPPSSYAGSTISRTGVPLPPSVYGGTPSVRSAAPIPGGFPGSEGPPPVIPLQPSSRSSGSGRGVKETYARPRRHDDDSDSSVSSGMGSVDSLTTPPARARKLSGRSTPQYAAAPIPPTVLYPTTPRSSSSNSGASYTTRGARVPLPASVSGSISGSVVGGLPPRSSSVISGTRPPSEMGWSRSPMMGGGRTLSSPTPPFMTLPMADAVIPIPIPAPSPITQPIAMPMSPMRPTTPLADIEHVIPIMTRAPSPVASSVTAVSNTTNTKGKKGRKKK